MDWPRAIPLVLAGVAISVFAAGCGAGARSISLAALATHQAEYQGQLVTTEGVVQAFGPAARQYFVVEDGAQHRVEVLPATRIAMDAGRRVEVTGRFEFVPGTGRVIEAQRISRTHP